MQQWNLREEIYHSFHQWIYLAILAVVGAAAGWGLSYLWKTPYEAATQLFVSINAYRAYADPQFSALANQEYTNQDDYKNWQMAELDGLVVSGEFMDDTLERLRVKDAYWKGITKTTLRDMLRAEWRTAGKWKIIARHEEARRAAEASQAWAEAIVKKANKYVATSRYMMLIDIRMQQAARDAGAAKNRLSILKQAQQMAKRYTIQLNSMPEDQAPDGLTHSQVLSLAALLADYTPAWQTILSEQPAQSDPASVYLAFLEKITPLIKTEEILRQAEYEDRMNAYEGLSTVYIQAQRDSHGLSPNLEIQTLDEDLAPLTTRLHPIGIFTLSGTLLGICAWVIMQIVRITRKIERNE